MNKIEQRYFILESLNSEFETHHDSNLKDMINQMFSDKIHSQHTAVMYSDHMANHGLNVIRLLNHNNEVEYHLHNHNQYAGGRLNPENQDRTSVLHALKIIKDDAPFYINSGRKIKLQSDTLDRHELYKRLAKHLIKGNSKRKVVDAGLQPGLTPDIYGNQNHHTIMIEGKGYGCVNFKQLLDN